MADNYVESYAHETVNVALDALRQVAIAGSLDSARRTAHNALTHLEGRRAALVAASMKQEAARDD